jgi:hypothetical protein
MGAEPFTPHPAPSPEGRGKFKTLTHEGRGNFKTLFPKERGTSKVGVTEGNRTLNPWRHRPVL